LSGRPHSEALSVRRDAAVHFGRGREAARSSARPARQSVPWERRPEALRLVRRGRRQRSARQAAARRVARAALSVQLSGRPHSEALPARRDAAVVPSCFRRVEEAQRPAALSGPAWWQVPAAASHQPAGAVVVESSVRPAASVPQVRLPAEEAAVVWGAKV
jgi:hypothetical protein